MTLAATQPLRRRARSLRFETALLDRLPAAVMICDVGSGIVEYANREAMRLVEQIGEAVRLSQGRLVGANLSIFGLDIAATRTALAGTRDASLVRTSMVGDESLKFEIVGLPDRSGPVSHAQLVWSVETGRIEAEKRHRRLSQMVEQMPINVMTCTREGFVIDYANATSLETLRRIEKHLPIKASQLIGSSIDVFHKRPEMQRRMLADASRLPHNARIQVGPETLDLKVSALTGPDGAYEGPMLTWALVSDSVAVANSVTAVVEEMNSASRTMEQASETLNGLTARSASLTSTAAAAAVEMSGSFREVSTQIHSASEMTATAANRADSANHLVAELVESIERIGNVSALIERIASQTNLLALNAAIEAARVGEAGKGFAVVASEVKQLALQTANATKEISSQVENVQRAGGDAARAVEEIARGVGTLRDVFTALSEAVEGQTSANESVSESIHLVSTIAGTVRGAAGEIETVSGALSGFADRLRNEVKALIER